MGRVALVAQHGSAHLQQVFGGGAVGVVAVGAVVADRLMVVHEGAALFHVAGVAGLIDAVALHQLGTNGTMRIVAI